MSYKQLDFKKRCQIYELWQAIVLFSSGKHSVATARRQAAERVSAITPNLVDTFCERFLPGLSKWEDGEYHKGTLVFLSNCMEFFLRHKKEWDIYILFVLEELVVKINLQRYISSLADDAKSTVEGLQDQLTTEKMRLYFADVNSFLDDKENLRLSLEEAGIDYLMPVICDMRNVVFAANIPQIVARLYQAGRLDRPLYFIVGDKHLSGLEALLGTDLRLTLAGGVIRIRLSIAYQAVPQPRQERYAFG